MALFELQVIEPSEIDLIAISSVRLAGWLAGWRGVGLLCPLPALRAFRCKSRAGSRCCSTLRPTVVMRSGFIVHSVRFRSGVGGLR